MRGAISKAMRFEVYKRDKFACQYCGSKAPDVTLNVDHVVPVAKGGTTHLMNLVTSCHACNNGKRDRLLEDDSAVTVARHQAELIEERRQQVELMAQWQVQLARLEPETEAVDRAYTKITGRELTEYGLKIMRKHIRKFGVEEVIAAIGIAYDRYDPETDFDRIGGICHIRRVEKDNPAAAIANRIFFYYRNQLGVNSTAWSVRTLLTEIARKQCDYDTIAQHIRQRNPRSWSAVHEALESLAEQIADAEDDFFA